MLINLCYCLTRLGVSGIHLWDLFQNISCYCLTYVAAGSCWSNCISKHLMLLFNCISTFFRTIFCTISKHLMLLFNISRSIKLTSSLLFQNISCYCLTSLDHPDVPCLFISKHLMLLFNITRPKDLAHRSNFKTSHVIV